MRHRSISDHPLQGSHHIQPDPTVAASQLTDPDPGLTRRRQWEELDPGLHLLDRALLVVGRVARFAVPDPEEVPGPALFHLLPVLLWCPTVPGHSCVPREGPSGLAYSLWW